MQFHAYIATNLFHSRAYFYECTLWWLWWVGGGGGVSLHFSYV